MSGGAQHSAVFASPRPAESDCELFVGGFWGQPVNAATSLAFVVAGVAIVLANRSRNRSRDVYGVLAILTGVGSAIFHGPAPEWAELVHDLPLVALYAFVAVDAASDLAGRRLRHAWWVLPSLVVVAVSWLAGEAGVVVEAAVVVVAVGASLLRLRARPAARRAILTAMALLGAGALIGTLSRTGGPLCDPDGVLQGHAIWHVLAALAVARLAPVVGTIAARQHT